MRILPSLCALVLSVVLFAACSPGAPPTTGSAPTAPAAPARAAKPAAQTSQAGAARGDYFAGKTLFRRFDPDCLDAYVRHGLARQGESLRLKFDAATEISIYRSVPHRIPGKPRQLKVPLALVRGRHSNVVLPHHARLVKRVPQGQFLTVPGGHMFPLERPQETAELLKSVFGRWDGHSQEASS